MADIPLYIYLWHRWRTSTVTGTVLEIGCIGATDAKDKSNGSWHT
jgi:hypothetical protein